MNCPACARSIPEESIFCMFCGERVSATIPLNTRKPVEIGDLAIWFERGIQDIGGGQVTRKLGIALRLADGALDSTAYDGKLAFRIRFGQPSDWAAGLDSAESQTVAGENQLAIRDFARSNREGHQGRIWHTYSHPTPIVLDSERPVRGTLELWFTPRGIQQTLFKSRSFSLSPKWTGS